jgi:hypothetical protein
MGHPPFAADTETGCESCRVVATSNFYVPATKVQELGVKAAVSWLPRISYLPATKVQGLGVKAAVSWLPRISYVPATKVQVLGVKDAV